MCIFLCLCQTKLFFALCCKELTKGIFDGFFLKCNDLVWNCLIIIFEAYIGQRNKRTFKSGKCIVTECSGDLTGTIRTEVEENNGIIFFYNRNRFASFTLSRMLSSGLLKRNRFPLSRTPHISRNSVAVLSSSAIWISYFSPVSKSF